MISEVEPSTMSRAQRPPGLSEEGHLKDRTMQLHQSMLTVTGDISTGLWSRCSGVICHARGLGGRASETDSK